MKKVVTIEVDGEDVELDKDLVEKIMDIAIKNNKTFEEIFISALGLYFFTHFPEYSPKESVYIDTEYQMAIYNNAEEKLFYSCDLNLDGTLNTESAGILLELNSKIMRRVKEYFKVDITEYAIEEV